MGEVPSPSSSTMPGPGRAWVTPGPGGGPWSATAHSFVQHQLSHAVNFWRQGRPAVFHLQSRSDGQAKLSLTFQLPSPSDIIPPPLSTTLTPSPNSTTPKHPAPPTLLPKRPIILLFPSPPTTGLSSRQWKSHRRAVLHRASQQAAQSSRKRLRSSSPVPLPQQLRQDFSLQEESPGSSPLQENLREACPPSSPPSFSLNHASPIRRDAILWDALPCSPFPTPTPESLRRTSTPPSPYP